MPKIINTNIFIKMAVREHGHKFDYSFVTYKSARSNVLIKCKEHQIKFKVTPNNHLNGNGGCPKCRYRDAAEKMKYTNEEFLKLAAVKYKNSYEYLSPYPQNGKIKIKIRCKKHNHTFEQSPNSHLSKRVLLLCPGCRRDKRSSTMRLTQPKFIKRLLNKHKNNYDYSKVQYKGSWKHITIICKKHGEFQQIAASHLQGHGCPRCKESRGEKEIIRILEQNNISFIRQYTFQDCKNKYVLRFDFYLPAYGYCIEFDGKQHFQRSCFFSKSFDDIQKTDKIKTDYCLNKNIPLLRISYLNNIEEKLNSIL